MGCYCLCTVGTLIVSVFFFYYILSTYLLHCDWFRSKEEVEEEECVMNDKDDTEVINPQLKEEILGGGYWTLISSDGLKSPIHMKQRSAGVFHIPETM